MMSIPRIVLIALVMIKKQDEKVAQEWRYVGSK